MTRKAPTYDPAALTDRQILRALLGAAVTVEGEEAEDLSWTPLRLERKRLAEELLRLAESIPGGERRFARGSTARRRLLARSRELADRLRLRVWRVDDLEFAVLGRPARVPRALVGEALGALGSELLPTRRRALRGSIEAAREATYLGASDVADRALPSPVDLVRQLLGGDPPDESRSVLFEEARPLGRRDWSIRELLEADPDFHRPLLDDDELGRFQRILRQDPLDGNTVLKLREFFDRSTTVGVRDSVRWTLGARHPWFDWERARELLGRCFARWGDERFLPRLVRLYTHDVRVPEPELESLLQTNREVAERLAAALTGRLAGGPGARLDREALVEIAAAALDYRHDHPDFDVEAAGRQGGETTVRFVGRAALDLARGLAGQGPEPRANRNFVAYFEVTDLSRRLLGDLDETERERVLGQLEAEVQRQAAAGALAEYRRPPMVLYTFYESAAPAPRRGEKLVDSFRLSEARSPAHALHMERRPEITEKLVVFFTLVLRHYLDTGFAPDLMPAERVKDFMLLGLWGHNTPSLVINLYQKRSGKVRSEIRFVGRGQVKSYSVDEDGISEAALARMAVSQLGPLLEPSILRALAGFVMAVEEQEQGAKPSGLERVGVARHAVEVYREGLRKGIRGTLVDLAATLEVLVDDSADLAQRGLDRVERLAGDWLARSGD